MNNIGSAQATGGERRNPIADDDYWQFVAIDESIKLDVAHCYNRQISIPAPPNSSRSMMDLMSISTASPSMIFP